VPIHATWDWNERQRSLAGVVHAYRNAWFLTNCADGDATCITQTATAQYGPTAAQAPLVATELGDGSSPTDGDWHVQAILTWLDGRGASYTAWTWNTWNDWHSLITDYTGTPTSCYGADVKTHITNAATTSAPTATSVPPMATAPPTTATATALVVMATDTSIAGPPTATATAVPPTATVTTASTTATATAIIVAPAAPATATVTTATATATAHHHIKMAIAIVTPPAAHPIVALLMTRYCPTKSWAIVHSRV